MSEVFLSIVPIFLIMLLGAWIKRYWITSEDFWSGLEQLSYFLLFPAVLFNYISTANLSAEGMKPLIFGIIIATLVVTGILIVYKNRMNISDTEFTSIFQGSVRYNSYIFFALGNALYGEYGLEIVAVVSAYMIIITNVISVVIFNYYIHKNTSISESLLSMFQKFITNPLIISSICGFIFNATGVRMNLGIHNTLVSLSNAALAIGLINVGAGLKLKMHENYLQNIAITSFFKLLVMPIVIYFILTIFIVPHTQKAIGVLYGGLPCASTAYILSKQLGGDANLMASLITITTILSIFSLSIIMFLVR